MCNAVLIILGHIFVMSVVIVFCCLLESPSISVSKSTTGCTPTEALGGVCNYTFEVNNTGDVTLRNILVEDPLSGLSAITCSGSTGANGVVELGPGASATCTATYTLTQEDVDRGELINTALARGVSPLNVTVNGTDSEFIEIPRTLDNAR